MKSVDVFLCSTQFIQMNESYVEEGAEGVKWELGFELFFTGKIGFDSLGMRSGARFELEAGI